MENDFENYAPHIVGSVIQVTGNLVGRTLIDDLRKRLSPRRQVERGDYFRDQSRELLQRHLTRLPAHQKRAIRRDYNQVRATKQRLEDDSLSASNFWDWDWKFQKLRTATKYKRLSKETYLIIRKASGEAIDDNLDNLMAQIDEATRVPQVAPGNTFGTTSTLSNPFTDAHAALKNVSVNDLNAVEMTTYETETTGEAAVVLKLDMNNRDASTRHVVATFPTVIFTGDRTDQGASQFVAPKVSLSVHCEDGTSSHLVSTPLPHLSPGDRTNENTETRAVPSVTPAEEFQVGSSGQ